MGNDPREASKEFTRFLRSFCQRTAQIVVQSRLGQKARTSCKIHAEGSDWFSLSTDDMPEVTAETKKILAAQPLSFGISFCVEISLRTVEGAVLVLEQWCLSLEKPSAILISRDREIDKVAIDQMGIMLKSLVVLTRLTLTYKLSRQQGPESHVICYKIYMGQPNTSALGEGKQHLKIGHVPTSCGTVALHLDYRTKLAISPEDKTSHTMMMKSDHFKPDNSPRLRRKCNSRKDSVGNESGGSEEYHDPMPLLSASPVHKSPYDSGSEKVTPPLPKRKVGAFADEVIDSPDLQHSLFFVSDVPFSSLLEARDSGKSPKKYLQTPPSSSPKPSPTSVCASFKPRSATKPHRSTEDDRSDGGSIKSNKSSASLHSAFDEFVMVELKSPFVEPDPENDLGTFFRQCQAAPPLSREEPDPTLSDLVTSLNQQVETLTVKKGEYDSLVEQLQEKATEIE